ncbi:MAG: hypothetical protein WBZ40_07260 [Acidimicrobiia bacterium]
MSVETVEKSSRIEMTTVIRHPAVVGAVLWWVGLAIEYPNDLFPPGDGSVLYLVNGGIFLAAMTAWIVAIVRWRRERGAGAGRVALWGYSVWAIGFALLVLATIITHLTQTDENVLFPVGGPTVVLGGIVVTVAALRADVPSRGRWAMVTLGLGWVVFFLIPPVLFGDVDPTWWTESLLGGLWFVAGALTASRRPVRPVSPTIRR